MARTAKPPLALKLLATRIAKLRFEAEKPPADETCGLTIALGHSFDYVAKDTKIFVQMVVNVSGEEAPFEFEMEFEGMFLLNRKATKKEVEPLAGINCPAILFPYVRETVAEITRRAGYAPLHLDSVNFVESFKKQEKQSPRKKKITK